MILSRIIHHLKTQNWTAVALEFVIVVAGVVIGFQVTAWGNARADREIITRQLHEVREDVRADIAALDITRTDSLWRVAAADHIIARVEGEAALTDFSSVAARPIDAALLPEVTEADYPKLLARSNLIRGFTGQRTGYESLVSAGNLRLIESDALRIAIQRYFAGYEDLVNNQRIYRDIRAAGLPILYRHGFSIFSEVTLEDVLAAANEDPAFTAYLRSGRELGLAQTEDVLLRQADARILLTLLAEALDE